MAGLVTQVPRLVPIEPDPTARTTQAVRQTAVDIVAPLRVTQVSRGVLVPSNEGSAVALTTQVARLVLIPFDEDSTKILTTQVSRRVAFAAPVVSGGERSFGYIIS